MPKVSNIDWNLARCLFVKGMDNPDICSVVGCSESALRSQRKRNNWMELRAKVTTLTANDLKTEISSKVESPSTSDDSEGDAWGKRMRTKLMQRVEAIVDTLPVDTKALPSLNAAADVIRKIQGQARDGGEVLDSKIVDFARVSESELKTTDIVRNDSVKPSDTGT